MKIKDTLCLCCNQLLRKKYNFLIIAITITFMTGILFCSSFSNGLNKYWDKSIKKNIEYRTFFVYNNNSKLTETEIIEKLKKYSHVVAVEPAASKSIACNVANIKNSSNSNLTLIGSVENPVEIIKGTNLKGHEKENAIICPKEFYPYVYDKKKFNKKDIINLEDKIGTNIILSPADSTVEIPFKLVGIYDSSLSTGSFCYTFFSIVNRLNNKYLPKIYEKSKDTQLPFIVVLDNARYSQKFENAIVKDGFISGGTIRLIDVNNGEKIINIILIISIFFIILYFLFVIFFNCKEYNNNKNYYGIYKTIGYSEKNISNIFLINQIIIMLVSFLVSIMLYYLLRKPILKLVLNKFDMKGLSLILSFNSIFFTILIGFIILALLKVFFNIKIKKESAIDLLKE